MRGGNPEGTVHRDIYGNSLSPWKEVTRKPIVAGDACLYPGHSRHKTVYFFQRHIASQIKREDPATLEALAMMMTPSS